MTKAEQFEALALRCEQATRADRELDAAIYIVAVRGESPSDFRINPQFADYIPKYTDSLDAALTLVPEGAHVDVGKQTGWPTTNRCFAEVDFVQVWVAATPALALCAAALRARAQMERGK